MKSKATTVMLYANVGYITNGMDGPPYTVSSRFNEPRFNVKSRFKIQNLVTEMEYLIKKPRFSIMSRYKDSKCADGGRSLNRDFTVYICMYVWLGLRLTRLPSGWKKKRRRPNLCPAEYIFGMTYNCPPPS